MEGVAAMVREDKREEKEEMIPESPT